MDSGKNRVAPGMMGDAISGTHARAARMPAF